MVDDNRFQVPDFNDLGKWSNRVVSNLLYYQTNYFLSAIVIFLLITFLNPGEMILGIITMASSMKQHVLNPQKGVSGTHSFKLTHIYIAPMVNTWRSEVGSVD